MILKQTFDTVVPKQLFTKLYGIEDWQKLHFKLTAFHLLNNEAFNGFRNTFLT